MAIGIVIPSWPADGAEADDALGMFIALRRRGSDVRVFTPDGQSRWPMDVYHYDDLLYLLGTVDDLVIYHQSAQDQIALPYLNRLLCRLVVKCHGAGSPASLLPFSEQAARAARRQRAVLHTTLQLPADAFLVATELQAAELRKLGVPPGLIVTMPSFHSVDRLRDLADDPHTLRETEAHAVNVALIDDLGPWAGLELLPEILDELASDRSLPLHFHVSGRHISELDGYASSFMQWLAETGRGRITCHAPTARVRATLLRQCDAVMFLRDGPAPDGRSLEALGFSRPVVTAPNSDAAELCGPAACRALSAKQFARELRRLLLDQELLAQLSAAGRARFADQFSSPVLEARFIEELRAIKDRSLIKVAASTLQPGDDWFGIPNPRPLIESALAVADPLSPAALEGSERRRSFIDWIIREGSSRSSDIMHVLTSAPLLAYAKSIEVPQTASQLDAGMRLFWTFDRFAHSAFNLGSAADVAGLIRYYRLEAAAGYHACATAASQLDLDMAEAVF